MTTVVQKPNATHLKLWRWHFYARLFSMPFLVILSLSGLIYLFRAEIENTLYADRVYVPASSLTSNSLAKSLQTPAKFAEDSLLHSETPNFYLKSVLPPTSSERSTQFVFSNKETNQEQSVFMIFDWKNAKVSLDDVQQIANKAGMNAARSISIPKDLNGVFSVSAIAQSASEEKMIHIDQHPGKTLASVSFESYPLLAKGVSVGITLHKGRQLGSFNKWFVALLCVLLFVLCLSASVLWWKRRPTWSQLKAPSRVQLGKSQVQVFAAVGAFCFFFPTAGISLALVWILDSLFLRKRSSFA